MEFVLSIIVFLLAVAGLSIGVIYGRQQPKACSGRENGEDCSGCSNKKNCKTQNMKETL